MNAQQKKEFIAILDELPKEKNDFGNFADVLRVAEKLNAFTKANKNQKGK